MKNNPVFGSIPNLLTRLRKWPADTAWKVVMRRRLSPEEYVDRTFLRARGRFGGASLASCAIYQPGLRRAHTSRSCNRFRTRLMIEMTSRAYPNPERNGCPPYRTLFDLASSSISDDPVWKHIQHCSPCSMEIRTIKLGQQPRPS